MSRNAKIAGVAALAGIMMTVAIVAATEEGKPVADIPQHASGGAAAGPLVSELERCRKLTMPDAGCEVVWDANRRRFFGEDQPKGNRP